MRLQDSFHQNPIFIRLGSYIMLTCILALLVCCIPSVALADDAIAHFNAEQRAELLENSHELTSVAPLADKEKNEVPFSVLAPSSELTSHTLSISVDSNVVQDAAELITLVRLYDPQGNEVLTKEDHWDEPDPGTVRVNFNLDLPKLKLKPGIYTIETRIALDAQGKVTRSFSKHAIYIAESNNPLSCMYVLDVNLPPAYTATNEWDNRVVSKSDEIARTLISMCEELEILENTKLTLAVSESTLKDWNDFALGYNYPSFESNAEIQSQKNEDNEHRKLYQKLLETLALKQKANQIDIISTGYISPNIDLLIETADDPQILNHLSGDALDKRAMPDDITFDSKGIMIHTNSLDNDILSLIDTLDVPWVLTPLGTAELNTTSDVPYVTIGKVDDLKILLGNRLVGNSYASEDYVTLLTQVAKTHMDASLLNNKTEDISHIAIISLSGTEDESSSLLRSIDYVNSLSFVKPQTLETYAKSKANNKLNPVSDKNKRKEILKPRYSKEAEHAKELLGLLNEATTEDNPEWIHALRNYLVAQASGWQNQSLNFDDAIETQRALAASTFISEIFDSIVISGTPVELNSSSGSVPIVIQNENGINLTLHIKAHGKGQINVTDTRFTHGLEVGTRAGENYYEIPIRIESGPAGGDRSQNALVVDVYAGNTMIKTKTIQVSSTRVDLKMLFTGATVVFLLILVLLRKRLRDYGVTSQLDSNNVEQEAEEVIETLGDDEQARSDALEEFSGHELNRPIDLEELKESIEHKEDLDSESDK